MNVADLRRIMAGAALILGVAAAIVRTPARQAREPDQIAALDLARWIKAGQPGLHILDVRAVQEFDRYHIPTARSVPLEALAAASFDPGATLVVYSENGGSAMKAALSLRASGHEHVFALRGGVEGWLEDVMHPAIATDLTRYFGGFARKPGDAPLTVDALRRHGC